MKKFFIITILIFCLFSCKKEILKTKATGKVIDIKTGLPLPNVTVVLEEYYGGVQGLYGRTGEERNIFRTVTDANGNFLLEYRAIRKANFNYLFTYVNYYPMFAEIVGKKNSDGTYLLAPFSYYKLHIKNTSPFNQYDKFSYDAGDGLIGMNIDTVLQKEEFPSETFQINKHWSVKKNGITTEHDTTIIGTVGDTVLFDIFY